MRKREQFSLNNNENQENWIKTNSCYSFHSFLFLMLSSMFPCVVCAHLFRGKMTDMFA